MGEMNEMTDETRALAASYALGVLEADEAALFERLLAEDSSVAAEVAAFRSVAVELAHGVPLVQPSAKVKDGLFARIQAPQPVAIANIVRASETGWVRTPFPGVEVKRLFVDPVTGMITTLLKAAAGSIYPAHQHGGLEQVYVVDGDMIFDDHTLDTGDYEVSEGHTHHSAIRTTEGCLAVIIHSPDDKVFPA
jgi:anti-sigma factor ChrR (cupin superfamily)